MKAQIVPTFEEIFPGEDRPSLADIVKIVPTDLLIKVCCHINAQLYFQKERETTEEKIFISLINRIQDEQLRNAPYAQLEKFKKSTQNNIAIFPLPHTLRLMDQALVSPYFSIDAKHTAEQELNTLKGLLILNTEANEKMVTMFKNVDLAKEEDIYKVFWSSLLYNSTVLIRKDLIISIYKSLEFLKFLDKNYPKYLQQFLEANGVDSLYKIPIRIFELYSTGYNKEKDIFHSMFYKELGDKNSIIQNLTRDVPNFSREEYVAQKLDKNFKGIRSLPILKIKSGEYNISNWNFIIEKFYEGMVFDFYFKTNIKELKVLKSLENYKSRMGDDFMNPFFMNLMKEIFDNNGRIALKEKERNEKCDYDFYIRIKNHIFFFEFKDVLFPLNENYEEIKNTIDTKLVSNQNDKSKGITQILRQIEEFHKDPATYDEIEKEGIKLSDLVIYPILVYSDHAFGMTGVNHYLNNEFQQKLAGLNNISSRIMPLAMISLDFFLEEYANFQSGKLDLVDVVNLYYDLKSEKAKLFEENKGPLTLQAKYEGFDVLIREKVISYSKDQLKSVFFERILADLKPHLPQE